MKNITIFLIFTVVALFVFFFSTFEPSANAMSCRPVTLIFARGSGQPLNSETAVRFFDQIKSRVSVNSTVQYELGSEHQNGYRYPAVDVGNITNGNAIGAWLSGGKANDYGKSVGDGKNELKSYLSKIHNQCPESRFVLGGYSQGAQVMGESLELLSKDIRDKISFVSLFGDPKLYLPEGVGFNPPACRNEQLSQWRRVVENCDTDGGSLKARVPYLPNDMTRKVGLWCKDKDFVCGSSKNFLSNSGHMKYAEVDGAIDQAGKEIAEHLKLAQAIPTDTRPKTNPIGPDVFFIVDNSSYTWNMQPRAPMDGYERLIQKVYDITQQQHGRVGMIAFCGCNEGLNTYRPLSDNPTDVLVMLGGLNYAGYPIYDRATELKTLTEQAKQHEAWRPGAKRIIIPVPVTRARPTATVSSYRFAQLTTLTTTIPSFHIYPIVDTSLAANFDYLVADDTEVYTPSGSTPEETLDTFFSTFDAQLDANLRGLDYRIFPGEEVKFDASNSDAYHDTIARYEWDFTSDGTTDQVTIAPIVSHTYDSAFTGFMTVRVVTEGGLSDTAMAKVKVAHDLSEPTLPAPSGLKLSVTSASTIRLTWNPISEAHDGWVVSANGILLGRITPNQTFINISDVKFDEDAVYGIQAMMQDGTLGEMATVLLKSDDTIEYPSQTSNDVDTSNNNEQVKKENDRVNAEASSEKKTSPAQEAKAKERLQHPASSIPYIVGGAVSALIIAVAIYIAIRYRTRTKHPMWVI